MQQQRLALYRDRFISDFDNEQSSVTDISDQPLMNKFAIIKNTEITIVTV